MEAKRITKRGEEVKQAHIFVSGIVQGVGYRYFVRSHAKQLGLNGWVRNAEDGGVEIVLQGDEQKIEAMIVLCRQGPMLSKVDHIGFEWEESEEIFTELIIQK